MVTLGCSVGLAFLPVLLSLMGPVDTVAPSTKACKATVASASESITSISRTPAVQIKVPAKQESEGVELVHSNESPGEDSMRFTLTEEEKEEVLALKKACENDSVAYRSVFELAKYCLTVRSLVEDGSEGAAKKRTKLALQRLKKRRKWESEYNMDQIDNMEALKEIDKAAPGFFVVRYSRDKEGHNVVGHHMAYAPYDFMFASKENLGKYLAAEQWRLDLGAADLQEARKGIAVVSVADGLWGIEGAYRYLRVLTKANDNVNDMHPNRVRRVYTEIPVFGHHLIEGGKRLLPKKIQSRIIVHHTIEHLEEKLCKAAKGGDPMTIVEWCEQRNAVYEESVEKVRL